VRGGRDRGSRFRMQMKADSRTDLERIFKEALSSVPARGQGRNKLHTEPWVAFHSLHALAVSSQICFPITLTRRDKPDYHLHTSDGSIGIEITEAVPESYARAIAIANCEFPDLPILSRALLNLSDDATNAQIREAIEDCKALLDEPDDATNARIREPITDSRSNRGWPGGSIEDYWFQFMLRRLEVKRATASQPGFKLFDENWLLIYDNLPLPPIDFRSAAARLAAPEVSLSPFSQLLVLKSMHLFVIRSSGLAVFDVPPWQDSQK